MGEKSFWPFSGWSSKEKAKYEEIARFVGVNADVIVESPNGRSRTRVDTLNAFAEPILCASVADVPAACSDLEKRLAPLSSFKSVRCVCDAPPFINRLVGLTGSRRVVRVMIEEARPPRLRVATSVSGSRDASLELIGGLRNILGFCEDFHCAVQPDGGPSVSGGLDVPLLRHRSGSFALSARSGKADRRASSSITYSHKCVEAQVDFARFRWKEAVSLLVERRVISETEENASESMRSIPRNVTKASVMWLIPFQQHSFKKLSFGYENRFEWALPKVSTSSFLKGEAVFYAKVSGKIWKLDDQFDAIYRFGVGSLLSVESSPALWYDRFSAGSVGSDLRGFDLSSIGPKDGRDQLGTGAFHSHLFYLRAPLVPHIRVHAFSSALSIRSLSRATVSSLFEDFKTRASVGIGLTLDAVVASFDFSLVKPVWAGSSDVTHCFFAGITVE